MRSLNIRSREEKVPSASGALARCDSSELGCPSVWHVWLHPTADARSSAWDEGGLCRGERERGVGARWGSGCWMLSSHIFNNVTLGF